MSYQVLARKWRPHNFEELVGQEHVVRALVNALEQDRLHHAYLFSGTRGVGKTTIARILAKCLNCDTGMSAKPCGECAACVEIDEGRFVDLLEVDAASKTKVDDTRELLENVQYAPVRGRFKVYLIDEVHMLSGHSFNALLKTLEEPPPHVKFLLATTDPQKLPVTVLSRCLQFHLKRLDVDAIAQQMQTIIESEKVPAEPQALTRLARAADGSMRDGLSLLDQAIGFGGGGVVDGEVQSMLGTIERSRVADLLQVIAENDADGVLALVEDLRERGSDYGRVLNDLCELLHRVAVAQVVGASLAAAGADSERVAQLASAMSPEDVQLYYQIGVHGRRELNLAPDPRVGLEMTLLRMLAFRPQLPGQGTQPGQASGSLAQPAAATGQNTPSTGNPVRSGPGLSGQGLSGPGRRQKNRGKRGSGAAVSDRETGAPGNAANSIAESPPSLEPRSETPADTPAPSARANAQDAPAVRPEPGAAMADWESIVEALNLRGSSRELAANCSFAERNQHLVVLNIDQRVANLRTRMAEERLANALCDYFGQEIKLRFDEKSRAPDSPAARRTQRADELQRHAEESIKNDPTVTALEQELGAQIVPNTVRPVESGNKQD